MHHHTQPGFTSEHNSSQASASLMFTEILKKRKKRSLKFISAVFGGTCTIRDVLYLFSFLILITIPDLLLVDTSELINGYWLLL